MVTRRPIIDLKFHPGARQKFDTDAVALLSHVAERPRDPPTSAAFATDIHAEAIRDEDILGGVRAETRDQHGVVVRRYFEANGRPYSLDAEGCEKLARLVRVLAANAELRRYTSERYSQKLVLDWIQSRFEEPPSTEAFCDFIIRQIQADVMRYTVWTPIANLIVQSRFEFGGLEIRPLTASRFAAWESRALQEKPPERHDELRGMYNHYRKPFQGFAAFVMRMECEPTAGEDAAYEKADRALAILGIYTGTVLHPDAKCPLSMRGTWSVPGATFLFEHEGELANIKSGVRGPLTGMLIIQWSDADVARLMAAGMRSASELLALTSPNDFQKGILNALFLYARAAYSELPIDKVVHVLSSLESMLLKDENEPIQQNLGERIAVFTQTDLDRRKDVIRAVKDAYRLRSRYLHHGIPPADHTIIQNLLFVAWDFYGKLLASSTAHEKRLGFVQWIDDTKLG